MSQENVELTRRAFQAFNDRDLDTLLAGLHDDVEAYPRLAAVEGGYRGHEGVRRWWEQLLSAFPDFHAEIVEVRDLGEFMVVVLRVRGRGAGSDTPLDAAIWHVNEFRDGKVIRWRVYTTESEALEAVGLSEQNLDLVRRVYESFNRWGVDPSLGLEDEHLLHPEVEFHTYPNSPEAGVYRGPAAVIEYNQRLFGQFESVRIELEELLPAGDRVVVISRQHAVGRTGRTPIVAQVVEVWTIRDGLLAERHTFSTLAEALEAVGL